MYKNCHLGDKTRVMAGLLRIILPENLRFGFANSNKTGKKRNAKSCYMTVSRPFL